MRLQKRGRLTIGKDLLVLLLFFLQMLLVTSFMRLVAARMVSMVST